MLMLLMSADNGVEDIPKKSKPRPRSQTSKKAERSPAKKQASKYFKVKPETTSDNAADSDEEDDDFIVPTVALAASEMKKPEPKTEEEDEDIGDCEDDSDEDGDWEEVEGWCLCCAMWSVQTHTQCRVCALSPISGVLSLLWWVLIVL